MSAVVSGLIRWAIVIAMGLVTVWPDYGLLWQAIRWFPTNPFLVVGLGAAWVIPLGLVLPLTRKLFQIVSSAALVTIYSIVCFQLHSIGFGAVLQNLWLYALGGIFVVIGWLMVSTPLWRWARGVLVVQDADAHP